MRKLRSACEVDLNSKSLTAVLAFFDIYVHSLHFVSEEGDFIFKKGREEMMLM
jgi:hypothetical protein